MFYSYFVVVMYVLFAPFGGSSNPADFNEDRP